MKKILATLLCGAALFAAGTLRRAPGFCLVDTNGQWQDLADYRGKVVIVEFMQTNCAHCVSFSTVLNSLKMKYTDRLAILAIADPPDNPQTNLQFVTAHKLTYPLLLDQGQAAASYVRSPTLDLPTIYLIDGNGMIRNSWVYGVLTKDIFEGNGLSHEIDKLLVGAPALPLASPKK
jgi:peroxiredoxin